MRSTLTAENQLSKRGFVYQFLGQFISLDLERVIVAWLRDKPGIDYEHDNEYNRQLFQTFLFMSFVTTTFVMSNTCFAKSSCLC